MQDSFYNKINVSTRILIIFLFIFSLFIANSIYLIMFMTILLIIVLFLSDRNVKYYINIIKKMRFWLLFIFVTYIIVSRDIIDSLIVIYKIILSVFSISRFYLSVNYENLNNGIKTLVYKVCKNGYKCDKISTELVDSLYFIIFYMKSSDYIKKNYINNQTKMYRFSLKYYILPRIFYSINCLEQLKKGLKLKYYSAKIEEKKLSSSLIFVLSFMFFIIVFFREVIL